MGNLLPKQTGFPIFVFQPCCMFSCLTYMSRHFRFLYILLGLVLLAACTTKQPAAKPEDRKAKQQTPPYVAMVVQFSPDSVLEIDSITVWKQPFTLADAMLFAQDSLHKLQSFSYTPFYPETEGKPIWFLDAVNGLKSANGKYWVGCVNGTGLDDGFNRKELTAGDYFSWEYTNKHEPSCPKPNAAYRSAADSLK